MLINFNELQEFCIPNLLGGEGQVRARMSVQPPNQMMLTTLAPGASIGMHTHMEDSDMTFILSGSGKALCDGVEERLTPGVCHYCPKGSAHCTINDGAEELRFFTVVARQ